MRKHLDWLTGSGTGGAASVSGRVAGRVTRRAAVVLVAALVPAAAMLVTAGGASATTVPPPPAGWTTTFSDAFSGAAGSGVDGSWTYDQGTQYTGSGCAANWGTGEVERNTNSTANVSEDGSGHLNITPVNSGGSWTSGRSRPSRAASPPRPAASWRSAPRSSSPTRAAGSATGPRSGCSARASGPAGPAPQAP